MIDFHLDGTNVIAKVTSGYEAGNAVFSMNFNCGQEWVAKMLYWHLTRRMQTHLEDARKQAYASGWKDAKAHSKKRTWFSCRWVAES